MKFCKHLEKWEIFIEKVMRKRLRAHTENKRCVCQIERGLCFKPLQRIRIHLFPTEGRKI
jgi:hypothetical protein